MEYLELHQCIIDDNSLRLLVLGIGGIGSLTQLRLVRNVISSVVHQALAALLEDTNCNLRELVLVIQTSWATDECVKSLARSLRYNKKLKVLKFVQGRTISEVGVKALSDVLCDTSSVNATYLSNHALHFVTVTHPYRLETPILPELLAMNHVEDWKTSAVKKILHTHPHFNVEPFLNGICPYFLMCSNGLLVFKTLLGLSPIFQKQTSIRGSLMLSINLLEPCR